MEKELIKIDRAKHQYVIGIDFGHAETSAAICQLEWDKSAGTSERKITDIRIAPGNSPYEEVLVSAIGQSKDGQYDIGNTIFDAEKLDNYAQYRIGFKQPPHDIDGKNEQLMIAFMRCVYLRIRRMHSSLTDENHVVYIARPSGWTDNKEKDLYIQMALEAGLPLAGLTSESRAAMVYAKNQEVGLKQNIDKGFLLFDLGSSTLDLTYRADDKMIDYGYPIGASHIDKAIYNSFFISNPRIRDFVNRYGFSDILLYKARELKEQGFSRNKLIKTIEIREITDDNDRYKDYNDEQFGIRLKSMDEIKSFLDNGIKVKSVAGLPEMGYIQAMRAALIDFKNKLNGRPVYGIMYTGGASRMVFIPEVIKECFEIEDDNLKPDPHNPSLTVSRGIANLGCLDALSNVMVNELLTKKLPEIVLRYSAIPFRAEVPTLNLGVKIKSLIDDLTVRVANTAWSAVVGGCNEFKRRNLQDSYGKEELEEFIRVALDSYTKEKLQHVIEKVFSDYLYRETSSIKDELNQIISYYAPGREIKHIETPSLSKSVVGFDPTEFQKICMGCTNHLVSDLLWAALGIFLFGVFALLYYVIKGVFGLFKSEEEKRQELCQQILSKKDEIVPKIRLDLKTKLSENYQFADTLSKHVSSYFESLIKYNVNLIRIPIE